MTGLVLTALLTVVVHNAAEVPESVLVETKITAERIFTTAGVTVVWAVGEPQGFMIHVNIRRQPGGGPGTRSPAALGTTIGDHHTQGGSTFVFYERVLKCAHTQQRSVATMLAFAIAHEMGHVLLPAPAHTPAGLMKAEWEDDDMRHLTTGGQTFNPHQIELMNATIERYDLSAAKWHGRNGQTAGDGTNRPR
jgi:hypothetical protein